MKWIASFILLMLPAVIVADFSNEEQHQIDSMTAIINDPNSNDTILVDALLDKAWYYYIEYPDSSIILCEKAKYISENLNYIEGKSGAYAWLGYLYNDKGVIEQALDYFDRSLKLYEQLNEKEGIANSYNNLGAIYKDQGDVNIALEYYQKSLTIREEIGDKQGMANSYNNMGIIYKKEGKIELALEHYKKSLVINEELNNSDQVAGTYNNIGALHDHKNELERAMQFYSKSLLLYEKIDDKQGQAIAHNNIGSVQLKRNDLTFAQISLEKGLSLAQAIGSPHWISEVSNNLSKLFKQQGEFEHALEMYELHIQMRDSTKNEATQKAAIRQQTKYTFEKAQLVREQEEKEAARVLMEETSRRDNLQYSVVLIFLLVIGVLVAMLGRLSLPERVAEGLIFFAFLIFFEFLLVLGDPYIENWTGGAPGLKLLINAGVAALIFPLHAFFEARLKGRLVKNNA